jgi:hypothetical protein
MSGADETLRTLLDEAGAAADRQWEAMRPEIERAEGALRTLFDEPQAQIERDQSAIDEMLAQMLAGQSADGNTTDGGAVHGLGDEASRRALLHPLSQGGRPRSARVSWLRRYRPRSGSARSAPAGRACCGTGSLA